MATAITEERMEERRTELQKQEAGLLEQLTGVRRELTAIDLYIKALHGQLPTQEALAARKAPAPKTNSHLNGARSRVGRGEQRARLADLLGKQPEGLTWPELKKVTGAAAGQDENRLYSALQNMRRSNLVEHTPDKRYVLINNAQPAPVTHAAE